MSNSIDTHLGVQLKRARQKRGLSQTDIARTLNISYQQVQKYERGSNRISASRLYELASILNMPLMYFYDGLPLSDQMKSSESDNDSSDNLVDYYRSMPNAEYRQLFRSFVRSIGNIGM